MQVLVPFDAAIIIQRCYRQHIRQRQIILHQKIQTVCAAKRYKELKVKWIHHQFLLVGSALCIQKWVRRVQFKTRRRKLMHYQRYTACLRIQMFIRRWLRKIRKAKRNESQVRAAQVIQRVFRGYLGRQYYKRAIIANRNWKSCLLIQKVLRGYLGRTSYNSIKYAKHNAARMFQRAFRGMKTNTIYRIAQASQALKRREQYERSLVGKLDVTRYSCDELYKRAKLLREKEELVKLNVKWLRNRKTEEQAVQKLKNDLKDLWYGKEVSNNNIKLSSWQSETVNGPSDIGVESILSNYASVRRKLYGVTEYVYTSQMEYDTRKLQNEKLKNDILDLKKRFLLCQQTLITTAENQQAIESQHIWSILENFQLADISIVERN